MHGRRSLDDTAGRGELGLRDRVPIDAPFEREGWTAARRVLPGEVSLDDTAGRGELVTEREGERTWGQNAGGE